MPTHEPPCSSSSSPPHSSPPGAPPATGGGTPYGHRQVARPRCETLPRGPDAGRPVTTTSCPDHQIRHDGGTVRYEEFPGPRVVPRLGRHPPSAGGSVPEPHHLAYARRRRHG